MNVREEILDYINRNELTGALLLTGQWGCGKSYLVKEIAKELNDSKKAAVATISLFGLDSVSAINKRVKDEYTSFLLDFLGKKAKKLSKAITTVAKDSITVASVAAEGNPALSAASQGLSAVINYDLLGFVEIKNTVGKKDNERKFVLAFDDLERNNLAKKDLLGAINEYVENKQIRVIIVADEERIQGEEYKEYKEKLISRTIKMSADYGALIEQIIENYSETVTGYTHFLAENQALLKQVFTESKSNNLRTLKSAIADFERIYAAWLETGISSDNMKWALYTFAAEVFDSKAPPVENHNQNKKGDLFFLEKRDVQYANKGKYSSSFYAFGKWINSGIWSKESFAEELKRKYEEVERSPLDRLLLYSFWSLEQKDIDEGLPPAVDLAYKGELSREDMISLLAAIHALKKNSITLPCEVDYRKLSDGFDQRIKKVKRGEICEPRCHRFVTGDQIDDEAHELYKRIEKMEDMISAWDNRRLFIAYLRSEDELSSYSLKGLYIEEFDDELLDLFKKQYCCACNEDKRDCALALLGLVFDSTSYSTKENFANSRRNFEKLIKWLSTQNGRDSIATIINKSFISQIQESRIMQMGL